MHVYYNFNYDKNLQLEIYSSYSFVLSFMILFHHKNLMIFFYIQIIFDLQMLLTLASLKIRNASFGGDLLYWYNMRELSKEYIKSSFFFRLN